MNRSLFVSAVLLLGGCGGGGLQAQATIEPKSGSTVSGLAVFTYEDNVTKMELDIAGASPGQHGVHLHEKGDCSAMDAMSAGGHWNPLGAMHGMPGAGHYGDTGNIEIGPDGTGRLEFTSTTWQIAPTSTVTEIVGRAVIFHEKVDDFMQPAGNAGARQGCGVIVNKL